MEILEEDKILILHNPLLKNHLTNIRGITREIMRELLQEPRMAMHHLQVVKEEDIYHLQVFKGEVIHHLLDLGKGHLHPLDSDQGLLQILDIHLLILQGTVELHHQIHQDLLLQKEELIQGTNHQAGHRAHRSG